MAFTGTPTVTKVADDLVRITGISLAASAAGTISLSDGNGGIVLPENPTKNWKPSGEVTLADAVQVFANFVTDVAGYDEGLRIVKSGTGASFLITVTNDDGDVATPELELYVRYR